MNIELKILNKEFYKDTTPIKYATRGSAALDLVCTADIDMHPGEVELIPTGLALWISSKQDHRDQWLGDLSITGLILPRSGLGHKGLILGNTIGLIDADYQGELKVSAWNRNLPSRDGWISNDDRVITLKAGDRFAQLMFLPVIKPSFNTVEEFSYATERGEGNFGSTGT